MSLAVFILGTIIGSFLNVVVLRLNTGESLVKKGSRCFSCAHKLKWFDLIPVLSFFIQRGRCRYCNSKISWQYPLVELATGTVFLLVFSRISHYAPHATGYYWVLGIGYWLAMFSILIVISVYDLRHQIIPNRLVYSFILLAGGWWLAVERASFSFLLSGLVFSGFFALLWLISRGRWMGFGDAKLALGLGLILGPQNTLAAFLFSFWIGGLVGIFLLLMRRKFSLKSQIPFAPFLAIGSFLAFLVGEKFIHLLFGL